MSTGSGRLFRQMPQASPCWTSFEVLPDDKLSRAKGDIFCPSFWALWEADTGVSGRCFLAGVGLKGVKHGCGEAVCGACTVTISRWQGGEIQHRAVNACVCPVYAVAGSHVITVEGGLTNTLLPNWLLCWTGRRSNFLLRCFAFHCTSNLHQQN